MHYESTPFEIEVERGSIILHGDLDNSPELPIRCRSVFSEISRFSRETWTIDASDIQITPEGITTWIQMVGEFSETLSLYTPLVS